MRAFTISYYKYKYLFGTYLATLFYCICSEDKGYINLDFSIMWSPNQTTNFQYLLSVIPQQFIAY